jgi:organic hydroperoxide reductase OsmC/OhrA
MSVLKDFRYSVGASRLPHRRVRLTSPGKAPLEAATPPEFRGGTPGVWSPEELLVAAVASCYTLTLDAVAAAHAVPIRTLSVEGVGHVTRRAEGRIGFVAIELRVTLDVPPTFEAQAEQTARAVKRSCVVAHALQVPVELELDITSAPACTTRPSTRTTVRVNQREEALT